MNDCAYIGELLNVFKKCNSRINDREKWNYAGKKTQKKAFGFITYLKKIW